LLDVHPSLDGNIEARFSIERAGTKILWKDTFFLHSRRGKRSGWRAHGPFAGVESGNILGFVELFADSRGKPCESFADSRGKPREFVGSPPNGHSIEMTRERSEAGLAFSRHQARGPVARRGETRVDWELGGRLAKAKACATRAMTHWCRRQKPCASSRIVQDDSGLSTDVPTSGRSSVKCRRRACARRMRQVRGDDRRVGVISKTSSTARRVATFGHRAFPARVADSSEGASGLFVSRLERRASIRHSRSENAKSNDGGSAVGTALAKPRAPTPLRPRATGASGARPECVCLMGKRFGVEASRIQRGSRRIRRGRRANVGRNGSNSRLIFGHTIHRIVCRVVGWSILFVRSSASFANEISGVGRSFASMGALLRTP